MKSRITIEVDFENNSQPIIQIKQMDSEDVRDKLIAFFLEQFGHTSTWCKIEFEGGYDVNNDGTRTWTISPIRPVQLRDESSAMTKQANLLEQHPIKSAVLH